MATCYLFLVLASLVLSSNINKAKKGEIKFMSLTSDEKSELFDEFKAQFGRTYSSTAEEEEKFSNFKAFLKLVDTRNAKEEAKGGSDGGARHSVTKFADVSEADFKRTHLNFDASASMLEVDTSSGDGSTTTKTSKMTMSDMVTTFGRNADMDMKGIKSSSKKKNWAGTYTTDVKDQGYCGSCWAFSAVEQIESDSIRKGYTTTSEPLSTQQLVSCDDSDLGCDGGATDTAYWYVYRAGGIEKESTYPYTSYYDYEDDDDDVDDGTCKAKKKKFKVRFRNTYAHTRAHTHTHTYTNIPTNTKHTTKHNKNTRTQTHTRTGNNNRFFLLYCRIGHGNTRALERTLVCVCRRKRLVVIRIRNRQVMRR